MNQGPIGVFDSGYGGLTILREVVSGLPDYDFLYLGDNARSPYGNRSFETIYQYTLQCVRYLFARGCRLVILACNTASAKALRNIQQLDLPVIAPNRRVLGVIRPTVEVIGDVSANGKVGILGTPGTVSSESYVMEIHKLFPHIEVFQEACPMWAPLVENGELEGAGAAYFVENNIRQLFAKSAEIDVILLACTHYPLLLPLIRRFVPEEVKVIAQGGIVSRSLRDYLFRHPEIDRHCAKEGRLKFHTSGDAQDFDHYGSFFFGRMVQAVKVEIPLR